MNYLFTTASCPNCPRAKQLLSDSSCEFELVDASTPAGLEQAKQYNLLRVPALVRLGKTADDVELFSGLEGIQEFLHSALCS